MIAHDSFPGSAQAFGGHWTETKLQILRDYIGAFTSALSKQPFDLYYIDAFAGTGYRELPVDESKKSLGLLFEEQATDEAQQFLDGSARIALQTEPPFHKLFFIEQSKKRFAELQHVLHDFPHLAERTHMIKGDCNVEIPRLCAKVDWKYARAVLFLDPFGMAVDWSTMKAVAATQAIDVWVLFPVGIGVNRLLSDHLAHINPKWEACLTRIFGTDDWKAALYKKVVQQTLLDGLVESVEKDCTCRKIVDYYLSRLKGIFAGVDSNPKFLRNSKESPMYALCFAMGNPRPAALGLALKLAKSVLKS